MPKRLRAVFFGEHSAQADDTKKTKPGNIPLSWFPLLRHQRQALSSPRPNSDDVNLTDDPT